MKMELHSEALAALKKVIEVEEAAMYPKIENVLEAARALVSLSETDESIKSLLTRRFDELDARVDNLQRLVENC